MNKTVYVTAKIRADKIADSCCVAFWKDADTFHVKNAREQLTNLISGAPPGADNHRAWAIDLIEGALSNANDIDVTFENFAEAVLDAILDAAIPMPEEKEGAA